MTKFKNILCLICLLNIPFSLIKASPFEFTLFTEFPYKPILEFSLKGGQQRTLGRMGTLIPLQASDGGLWFMQALGLWSSDAAKEWNIGLGRRQQLADWIIGAYGFFDGRLSAFSHYYTQLTFGLELLGQCFEIRTNGYVPTTTAKVVDTNNVVYKVNCISLVLANRLEKPLGGFDMEIGGHVSSYKKLQGFLTYYHFNGSHVKAVDGIRLRGQLQLTNHMMLMGEVSYDQLRKNSWFLGIQLKLKLGASELKVDKSDKMTQMIVRDIDVITSQYNDMQDSRYFYPQLCDELIDSKDTGLEIFKAKRLAINTTSKYLTLNKYQENGEVKQIADGNMSNEKLNFIETKRFTVSSSIRGKIQSIMVFSSKDICLKLKAPTHLKSNPLYIKVPFYDVQGMPPCKSLKDLSCFMRYSYWHIHPIEHHYGIKVYTEGLGGGNKEEEVNSPLSRSLLRINSSSSNQSQLQSEQIQSIATVTHTVGREDLRFNQVDYSEGEQKTASPKALGVRPNTNPQFLRRQNARGEDVLELLKAKFSHAVDSLVVQVITGTAGLGKTELAIEYIRQTESDYDGIFWIQASAIPVNYTSFIDDLNINLKEVELELLAQIIHKNLMYRGYKKILWVYDNVSDAQVFHTELFNEELKYIWQQAETQVHILVTSRHQSWEGITSIQMELFDIAHTEAYIESFFKEGLLPFPKPTGEEIEQFNTLLEGLPLAIAQAVSYLRNQRDGTGIKAYMRFYKANYCQAAWLQYSAESFDNYEKAMWVIWTITRKILSKKADLLLQMSCFLSNDYISKLLFSPLWGDKMHKILKELTDYSLIKLSSDFESFRIHALLQKMIQLQQGCASPVLKEIYALVHGAQDLFNEKHLDTKSRVKHWLPHIRTFLAHIDDTALKENIFSNYGHKACILGDYLSAKDFYSEVLALKVRHYGEKHIQLADTLLGLGKVYYYSGQYEVAEFYYIQTLTLQIRYYGQDHIKIISALSNLGNVELKLDHHKMAKSYLEKALKLKIRYYGPDHIQLASTLNNLGILEKNLDHYEIAKSYYTQALALKINYYGQDHIQVASTLDNLGNVESSLGYDEVAKSYLEKALVLRICYYGEEHIQVADTLNNLSNIELSLGHDEIAKGYLEKALAIKIRHYGPDHIQVSNILRNLEIIEFRSIPLEITS